MANINRDYLIVLDAKSSVISEADELKYYITDEHSQNLFVNLVVRDIERINKYVEVHDPEKYQLELHIVKPNNDIVRPHLQANLLSAQDAIYAFVLPKEATDYIGTYKCELRVTYQETDETTITTSNKFKYKVKRSIYNDLDSIQDAPQYPVVIQLFDKLSDINQYEEDRRADELARQLAEQQRQTRFDALDADMVDSIQQMDDKVVEVENRITTKEQVVDKLITDTKADIDDYKTTKDTEINNAITAQDNKINTAITTQNNIITQAIANQDTKIDIAITAQNDKIEAVQNNDAVQNNKLDTLQNKATIHEERITATEVKNTEQDNRLDIIENTNIQQNSRLTAIEDKNIEQDNRLNEIEAIDVAQNTRLDAIEAKNTEQDDRLLDIEKVNKRQDMNLKCLFAELKNNMIDITEEGNSIYLQNSTTGYALIDEIKGNTLVNCNKEPDKELILNGNINTSGDNSITITEGVDGGLVDVALEGNTLVNVCDQKDPVAITKAYTVENSGNHVALQGEYDGKCRPVVTGNTLVNLAINGNGYTGINNYDIIPIYPFEVGKTYTIIINQQNINNEGFRLGFANEEGDYWTEPLTKLGYIFSKDIYIVISATITNSNTFKFRIQPKGDAFDVSATVDHIIDNVILLEGDYTNKPTPDYFEGLQSSFEDKVVTQEMVDNGEELAENLGKYKVDYVVTGKNKFNPNLLADCPIVTINDDNSITFNGTLDVHWPFKLKLPKGTYSGKCTDDGVAIHIFWDGYDNLISKNNVTFTHDTILDGYIRASTYDNYTITDCQIEEGIEATLYEPYKEYKKTFYLNSPLLEGDTIEQQGDNVVHVHRSELRAYETGDELTLPTDMTNTLVSKASPQYEVISQNDSILCDSYVNGHLDVDSVVPIEKVDFLPFTDELTYLYPSTQYAVQFASNAVSKVDITLGGAKLLNQDVVVGTNKYMITTPSELVHNNLVLNGEGFNASNIVVTEATDQDFGYFEGMKSVGECEELEVVSCNKNQIILSKLGYIVDRGSYTDTLTINENGSITYNVISYGNCIGYVCKVIEGKTYTFNIECTDYSKVTNIRLYADHYNQLQSLAQSVGEISEDNHSIRWVATYTGTVFARIWQNNGINTYTGIYFGEDDIIPHQSNTQTLTHEPLRAVGDIKDKYVLIDGKWYIERNCGEAVLDGSQEVHNSTNDLNNVYRVRNKVDTSNINVVGYGVNTSICDRYTIPNGNYYGYDGEHYYLDNDYIWLFISRSSCSNTLNDIKTWLSNNPTTIVYQLVSPTYEPIDYNPFTVYSDTTHISNNSTIPCNMIIKNTGYNCLLKPSTTYTVSSNLGLNTVTTPSTLTEDCLRFYDTDTSTVTTMKDVLVLEGDWTTKADLIPANFSGIESAFEQEYDAEKGKYKVNIKVTNEDKSKENNITFYINEPLRGVENSKDRVFIKDDKVVVQRNCGIRVYEDGDFGTYPTDKIDTVYPLADPVYEEVEYNDTKLFIESFKNSTLFYNSNVPVTSKLYYSYSVPIVDTVAQTASISDEQDVMIIDLATQVAVMEMLLM